MTDQEYVLCSWKERLWPAKVLCKTGAAGKTSVTNLKETSLEVEILGLKEQVRVSCAGAFPLQEERIETIAAKLDQRENPSEVVEDLKYRQALKLALDILNQNDSGRQEPGGEGGGGEGGAAPPGGSSSGSASSPPSARCQLLLSSEELGPEASEKKSNQETNPRLKAESPKSGTNPPEGGSGGSCEVSGPECQNPNIPESEPRQRERKIKPRSLPKSRRGNKTSSRSRKGKNKQGRKKPGGAGAPEAGGNGDWGKGLEGEGGSMTKQSHGIPEPGSLKRMNGEQENSTTGLSLRKRKRGNCPKSSSDPSSPGLGVEMSPAQPAEEEEENPSPVVLSKVKQFQLPDFEEDEGLEPSDLASKITSSEGLSCLSPLVDEEEEEEEELPSILSLQEPQSIEEGNLAWCKLGRYPYWPAVVKKVKRKHRRACVLLIEGNASGKKKGFSVSLKNLKHFDCEEKQELIDRAREQYRQEIEWCIRLISDYRIRVGCHSFTGSFLEYFAADISYPVRKEGYQGPAQMTFPRAAEEVQEEPPEASPQKPSKKLLPDRTRAARDRANKKIVEFIVKTKGAEEHLLAILTSRKQSRWLKGFQKSRKYMACVETYLEDEEQLDLVVNYLTEVYQEMDTKSLHPINGDGIRFISDVLLPEAIIYAISAVDDIDYEQAEEKYMKGPSVSNREREIFDEEILERKKQKKEAESADSS
ncbi:PWWP domain-containing DNA repair factor 3A isoform X2 [Heliangelus exortis]|uniref:PWWP domain-containing DNA repair factor 3A isoform X2 n=1 Tax=Heliangelus exortis TaxID=472823 RepID=UPI003A8CECF3